MNKKDIAAAKTLIRALKFNKKFIDNTYMALPKFKQLPIDVGDLDLATERAEELSNTVYLIIQQLENLLHK